MPAPRRRFQFGLPALMMLVFIASITGAIFGGAYRAATLKSDAAVVYVWLATLSPLGVMILISLAQPALRWLRTMGATKHPASKR